MSSKKLKMRSYASQRVLQNGRWPYNRDASTCDLRIFTLYHTFNEA